MDDVLSFAQRLVSEVLGAGDVAIDATAGNGHDTLFLAHAVGEAGRVYSFDVQAEALASTGRRLDRHEVRPPVTLLHDGHEDMPEHLPAEDAGQVRAVMFNLGYLPRADKSVITRPETTLPALEHAVRLIQPGGIITVVLYTGHEGGPAEAAAVERWAEALDQDAFQVLSYRFINQRNQPPRLIAIKKL